MQFPPSDFPSDKYEGINKAIAKFRDRPAYAQFVGAWNAVRYRYAAMVDFDDAFTDSVKTHGDGPELAYRYGQERDLFCFASNASSMFDAFYYAMYAVGALLKPKHFRLVGSPEAESKISPRTTRTEYAIAFEHDPVLFDFDTFSQDRAFLDLTQMRNILTHRAAPPRAFQVGNPNQPSATVPRLNLVLDEQATRSRRVEATRLLSTCVDTMATFISRHVGE